MLVVDEPALQTAGINTYLAHRMSELSAAPQTLAPLAVVTVDELETILLDIAAGDVSWDELLDERDTGSEATAKPLNTTFFEIVAKRPMRTKPNSILTPADETLTSIITMKYAHLRDSGPEPSSG